MEKDSGEEEMRRRNSGKKARRNLGKIKEKKKFEKEGKKKSGFNPYIFPITHPTRGAPSPYIREKEKIKERRRRRRGGGKREREER